MTSGGTPSRARHEFYTDGDISWVKTGELRDGYIESSEEKITAEAVRESSAKLLPRDTVLMAMYGATVGALGILNVPATCNQASCAMVVDPTQASARWLFYALLNDRDRIVSMATGAAQQNLSGKTIRGFEYATPPLPEQQAIAEVLGALDDKIAANTRLVATADELASAQFRSLRSVTTRSDAVYDDVAVVGGGGTPSTKTPSYWSGDIPWATPTDITGLTGLVLSQTARTISETGLAACASPLHPTGTILMTSRATIGAFAVAGVPLAVNQGFITVQSRGEIPNLWLLHEMRSRVDEFISWANGATFLELSRGNFRKLPVVTSSPEVMASFAQFAAPLHGTAANAIAENLTLAATRDALLPKLMSGVIRVKDAERLIADPGV